MSSDLQEWVIDYLGPLLTADHPGRLGCEHAFSGDIDPQALLSDLRRDHPYCDVLLPDPGTGLETLRRLALGRVEYPGWTARLAVDKESPPGNAAPASSSPG